MYESHQIKTGIFANMIGVNIKTLIYYDITGQFKAFRTDTNRRYYTKDHLKEWNRLHKSSV